MYWYMIPSRTKHHTKAMHIIDNARSIIIPSIVIHEYIWVMIKHLSISPDVVSLKVKEYVNDPRCRYLLERVDTFALALKMLHAHGSKVSMLNDYIILAVAMQNNALLATFDNELKAYAIRSGLGTLP
ncbi:hypothetical protein HRbin04_00106 [archaeon HR04]|nr:hypothetical protein HRbin04_00106 [archaeon HR04]